MAVEVAVARLVLSRLGRESPYFSKRGALASDAEEDALTVAEEVRRCKKSVPVFPLSMHREQGVTLMTTVEEVCRNV